MFEELRLCNEMIFVAKRRQAGFVLAMRKHKREGDADLPACESYAWYKGEDNQLLGGTTA
jgi:hypothetical protein